MQDLALVLAPPHRGKTKEEISAILYQEVEKFSQYMCSLGDWKAVGPLIPQEKVLLKTYLLRKMQGLLDPPVPPEVK